jgi:hypothetical protein
MVEAVSIVSSSLSIAINLIKLANQVAEGFAAYKSYGEKLVSIQKDLGLCKKFFQQWMEWYEIGKPGQGGEGIRYFGEDGWVYVQEHVARIDERMIKIIKVLSGLVKSPEEITKYENATAKRLPASDVQPSNRLKKCPPKDVQEEIEFLESMTPDRLQSLLGSRVQRVNAQNMAGFRTKIDNVLFPKLPDLEATISDLKLKIRELEELSARTAGLNHPSLAIKTDSHSKLSSSIDEIWEVNVSLQQRPMASSVYTVLQSGSNSKFQVSLELDLYHALARDWNNVSYGFITEPMTQSRTYFVLSVRQVQSGNDMQHSAQSQDFSTAVQAALLAPGQTAYLYVSTGDLLLAVSAAVSTEHCQKHKIADLTTSREYFGINQRYELAYRIADSGLRLLGTNWLSAMESQNLFLLQERDNNGSRWSLAFGDTERRNCHILTQIEDAMSTRGVPNSQEYFWQSYSIGLLLIELATESKILELLFSDEGFQSPLPVRLMVWVNGSEQVWTIDDAMGFVRQRFGQTFYMAVHSCLHIAEFQLEHEDELLRLEAEKDLVRFFYSNVFQP